MILEQIDRPVTPTVLVKLAFLIGQETPTGQQSTFYRFIPHKFGPFSFSLYRELRTLKDYGYVTHEEDLIALSAALREQTKQATQSLTVSARADVGSVVRRYGNVQQNTLLADVYCRYPWYATRSELKALIPPSVPKVAPARLAVYTIGYEGKSVDGFYDQLLRSGIHVLLDVRANPISRQYGFARKSLSEIAQKLGIEYRHIPQLGIPSEKRKQLSDYESYQRLLDCYEAEMLPGRMDFVQQVANLMMQKPSVLLCVEKDVSCCHRSRLAKAVSVASGLSIIHL